VNPFSHLYSYYQESARNPWNYGQEISNFNHLF